MSMLKELKKAVARRQKPRALTPNETNILFKTSIVLGNECNEIKGSIYYWKAVSIDFDTKTIQVTKDLNLKKWFGIQGIRHIFKMKLNEVSELD